MLASLRLSLLALLALAVLLGAADRLFLAELAQHFRPQLALLALAGMAALLLLRRRAEAAGALLLALLLVWPVVESALPARWAGPIQGATAAYPAPAPVAAPAAAAAPARLTLVSANLLHSNPRPDAVVDALMTLDADVLVLTEAMLRWRPLLAPLLARYPYRTPESWWGGTSTVVWSRHPFAGGAAAPRRLAGGAALEVTLQVGGRPLRLFALHALHPRSPAAAAGRDAVFEALGGWLDERRVASAIAGDFNATPWTPALRRLVERHGLERALPPRGWYASWPAPLGDLGIPIDHLLHGPGVAVERFEVLDIPGSDHRALEAEIVLP